MIKMSETSVVTIFCQYCKDELIDKEDISFHSHLLCRTLIQDFNTKIPEIMIQKVLTKIREDYEIEIKKYITSVKEQKEAKNKWDIINNDLVSKNIDLIERNTNLKKFEEQLTNNLNRLKRQIKWSEYSFYGFTKINLNFKKLTKKTYATKTRRIYFYCKKIINIGDYYSTQPQSIFNKNKHNYIHVFCLHEFLKEKEISLVLMDKFDIEKSILRQRVSTLKNDVKWYNNKNNELLQEIKGNKSYIEEQNENLIKIKRELLNYRISIEQAQNFLSRLDYWYIVEKLHGLTEYLDMRSFDDVIIEYMADIEGDLVALAEEFAGCSNKEEFAEKLAKNKIWFFNKCKSKKLDEFLQ